MSALDQPESFYGARVRANAGQDELGAFLDHRSVVQGETWALHQLDVRRWVVVMTEDVLPPGGPGDPLARMAGATTALGALRSAAGMPRPVLVPRPPGATTPAWRREAWRVTWSHYMASGAYGRDWRWA